jgi:hypothetical protein
MIANDMKAAILGAGMLKRPVSTLDAVVFTCGAVAFGTFPVFAGSTFDARSNEAAGVSIVVKPKPVEAGAKVWEFDVTMNTHIKPLSEDLTVVSVLVDGDGHRTKPIAWRGDKPGGHHRGGVLQFPAPAGAPATFEMQMTGVGGVDLRTFRWGLK